jgi:hypothetical protein
MQVDLSAFGRNRLRACGWLGRQYHDSPRLRPSIPLLWRQRNEAFQQLEEVMKLGGRP